MAAGAGARSASDPGGPLVWAPEAGVLGAVGEVDPDVVGGLRAAAAGRVSHRRSLDALLGRAPPAADQARDVSRFPASDIDLAFVVGRVRAGRGGAGDAAQRRAATCSRRCGCSTCTGARG